MPKLAYQHHFFPVKTEQALLLIAIQQTMGLSYKISKNILEERMRLYNKVKELKHVAWE